MTGLSWIDFFLRVIPEGFIIILAGYAVSKKAMNIKKYILASSILALAIFVYKILPISAALPLILSIITAIIILVFINKIKTAYAIISTIICFIVIIISEGINLFLLELFHINTNEILQNDSPFIKYLSGLPSLIILASIVIIYYFISRRKRAKHDDFTK